MRDMLKKGDALRPKYDEFDFESLDSSQKKWLSRLAWFTKSRAWVERYFRETKVSNEMKLLYVEQHSMKLGDSIFYTIESRR